MYEYLLDYLISGSQIESNLRRTASEGLISKLNKRQLIKLALKYFGVDEYGNYTDNKEKIVAYRCPYSGEIIDKVSDLHLDHIIPFNNGGGTVLFNCIPVYNSVNLSKHSNQLLGWWVKQNYFSIERLERLLQYILEAYSIAFNEYTVEELEESYNYFQNNEKDRIGDLTQDKRELEKRYQKSISFSSISYQQLITNIILYLKDNNIDCTKYESKLKELERNNIFNNVEKYELVEREIQNILKKINGNNNLYITYSLNININKLLNTLKTNDILTELNQRLSYIFYLLNENNVSFVDYLKNVSDIDDSINLLYFDINKITEKEKKDFVDNIRVGHHTKILLFLEMLKRIDEKNLDSILRTGSKERFRTYTKDAYGKFRVDKEYGIIDNFWSNNKTEILQIINQDLRYIEIRDKLDKYYMNDLSGQQSNEGKEKRIEVFIEMLRMANEKELILLLKSESKEKFETYKKDESGRYIVDKEYDEIGSFWSVNKSKILSIIYQNEKYRDILDKLDMYYMTTYNGQKSNEGKARRREVFIEMLRFAKDEEVELLLKQDSTEIFKTYRKDNNGKYVVDKEYESIKNYWNSNNKNIMAIIKQNEKYKDILDKLDKYYFLNRSGQQTKEGIKRRREVFIEMLRFAKDEELDLFLKRGSKEKFKTYKKDINGKYVVDKEYGEIGEFYKSNKSKILSIIHKDVNNSDILNKLDKYYFLNRNGQQSKEGKERRIEVFIEMLRFAKDEEIELLLKKGSSELFKTYKKDDTGKYVVDKEYDQVGSFWYHHHKKILSIIRKKEKYKEVLDKIDKYYMMSFSGQKTEEGIERRVNTFINMLRVSDEKEIELLLKRGSNETFKTYKKDESGRYIVDKEYDEIGGFWSVNKSKILSIIYQNENNKDILDKLDNFFIMNLSGQQSDEGKERRMDVFIEMLGLATKDELRLIFQTNSPVKFKTYKRDESGRYIVDKEYGNIGSYWVNSSQLIIPNLFYSDKYSGKKYDRARQIVLDYLNYLRRRKKLSEFQNIGDYLDVLDKTKAQTKSLIKLRDKLLKERDDLIKENTGLKEQIASVSRRRAI